MNIKTERKMLGFTHIPEIGFSPTPFTLKPRQNGAKTTPVFLYYCILNPPPQMFCRNIRIEWKFLVLHTSQKSVPLQPPFILKQRLNGAKATPVFLYFCIFTGPRCPVYGSRCLSLCHSKSFLKLFRCDSGWWWYQLNTIDDANIKRSLAIRNQCHIYASRIS